MAHLRMTNKARKRLEAGKVDAEVAMLRAPCRGCNKTVNLAPSSTKERFGVRCLFCLYPFCVRCGEKHFEKKKLPKLKKGVIYSTRKGFSQIRSRRRCLEGMDTRLKKMEKQLAQVLKQGKKR